MQTNPSEWWKGSVLIPAGMISYGTAVPLPWYKYICTLWVQEWIIPKGIISTHYVRSAYLGYLEYCSKGYAIHAISTLQYSSTSIIGYQ